MGMAASQARFLTLTARKSNTEYQGQQVNQQRTSLANESANIYNKLANMEVPTVPSKTSYNKNLYTFKDANGEKYSITNIANIDKNDSSKVLVKIKYNTLEDYAGQYNLGSVSDYSLSNNKLTTLYNNTSKTYSLSKQDKSSVPSVIADKKNDVSGDWYFAQEKSSDGTLSSTGIYIHSSEFKAMEEAKANGKEYVPQYYQVETNSTPTTKEVKATMTPNSNGRYTSVELEEDGAKTIGLENGGIINLSYEYGTDEEAYEEAMSDYEFKKAQYDQEVNVLNSKTEVIQNQDKRLELKLKQLDTERSALETEMDAVKTYLQKNVENTFKTFG